MAGRAPKRVRADERHADRRTGGRRFAIVVARFNEPITEKLLEGARHALEDGGVAKEDIDIHRVPGSFELPVAAAHLARSGRYAGIVCVGVVIRGETPHFEHVAREAAAGIRQVAVETGVPTTFGVITTLDEAQAWARAGGAVGNRGEEAAEAALEMADFVARFGATPGPIRRASRAPGPRARGKPGRRRLT